MIAETVYILFVKSGSSIEPVSICHSEQERDRVPLDCENTKWVKMRLSNGAKTRIKGLFANVNIDEEFVLMSI